MILQHQLGRDQREEVEGAALVRRFTDELKGNTTLERATIAAQKEDDRIAEERYKIRTRQLYDDRDGNVSNVDFHVAEAARMALEKTCNMLASDAKISHTTKLGMHRKSARAAANEIIQPSNIRSFMDLRRIINELEVSWKGNQSEISCQFRRLCNTLDAHSNAFAIFPSQNNYASALCGGLAMIVSAAANHDSIAETISQAAADIAVKAKRVSDLLHLVKTHSMRESFSELYAQVFLFYRDAIEWYMKSKTSRFFGSFNEKVVERYEKAERRIEQCLVEMYREAEIARFAMLTEVHFTATEMKDELMRQRQRPSNDYEIEIQGRRMQEMLLVMNKCLYIEGIPDSADSRPSSSSSEAVSTQKPPGTLTRAELRDKSTDLESHIVGSEGYSLFQDGTFWLPETGAASKLHDWMDDDENSKTLWILSPDTAHEISSARAAALAAVVAAWKSEVPVISHFCERPRFHEVQDGLAVEEIGLIGLIYSLISQLLQFNVTNDQFQASEEQFNKLDGSIDSWNSALVLFSELLSSTPHLSICIVHGLNDLSFSSGADWCHDFLKILLEHQAQSKNVFRILLTTSGHSRVLPDYIPAEEQYFALQGAREMKHGGQWVTTER